MCDMGVAVNDAMWHQDGELRKSVSRRGRIRKRGENEIRGNAIDTKNFPSFQPEGSGIQKSGRRVAEKAGRLSRPLHLTKR